MGCKPAEIDALREYIIQLEDRVKTLEEEFKFFVNARPTPVQIKKSSPPVITTKMFSELAGVEVNTIRSAICRKGGYLGVSPIKMQNGRVVWNAEEVKSALDGKKNEDKNQSVDLE